MRNDEIGKLYFVIEQELINAIIAQCEEIKPEQVNGGNIVYKLPCGLTVELHVSLEHIKRCNSTDFKINTSPKLHECYPNIKKAELQLTDIKIYSEHINSIFPSTSVFLRAFDTPAFIPIIQYEACNSRVGSMRRYKVQDIGNCYIDAQNSISQQSYLGQSGIYNLEKVPALPYNYKHDCDIPIDLYVVLAEFSNLLNKVREQNNLYVPKTEPLDMKKAHLCRKIMQMGLLEEDLDKLRELLDRLNDEKGVPDQNDSNQLSMFEI